MSRPSSSALAALATPIVTATCLGSLAFFVYNLAIARDARDFSLTETSEVGRLLEAQPGSSERAAFAFYALLDLYLDDGAEILVAEPLATRAGWLRNAAATRPRVTPLIAPSEAELESARRRAAAVTILGRVPAYLVADPTANRHVLIESGGAIYLLPEPLYRELGGR